MEKGYKKSSFNSRNSNNKCTERNGQKSNLCFICGLEDQFIKNCQKPDTSDKKTHWNTEKTKTHA